MTFQNSMQQRKRLFRYGFYSTVIFIYLLCLLGMMVLSPKSPSYSMGDFGAYYFGGKAILNNPASLYDSKPIIAGFVNMPILAYLFAPFALLPHRVSETIFFLISIVSLIYFGVWSIGLFQLSKQQDNAFLLAILTSFPLFNSLRLGNTTHFILLLLLICFVSIREKKQVQAGILLGLAGLIKIPLLFMLLFFISMKYWKAAAAFLTTIVFTVLTSLIVCGIELNYTWFQRCILDFSGKSVPNYNVQSIDGFLLRITPPIPFSLDMSWLPVELSSEARLISRIITALMTGIALFVCYRLRKNGRFIQQVETLTFSIFLALSLMVAPISWTHYYLLLLLPLVFYIAGEFPIAGGKIWPILMLTSIILFQFPFVTRYLFQNSGIGIFVSNLLISHNLIGAFVLFVILLISGWRLSQKSLV